MRRRRGVTLRLRFQVASDIIPNWEFVAFSGCNPARDSRSFPRPPPVRTVSTCAPPDSKYKLILLLKVSVVIQPKKLNPLLAGETQPRSSSPPHSLQELNPDHSVPHLPRRPPSRYQSSDRRSPQPPRRDHRRLRSRLPSPRALPQGAYRPPSRRLYQAEPQGAFTLILSPSWSHR